MPQERLISAAKAEANAQGRVARNNNKGKAPNTITLPELKEMVLPLLEREGFYDPSP